MEVYLRAFEVDDYKRSVLWRNNREIKKTLGGNNYFVSSEREKKWIENALSNDRDSIRLAICKKDNDTYIGNVNLVNIDWVNGNAEFSIFIGEENEWGKGYGTMATILMLKFGFHERNLHRIYLKVLESNKAAIHLYAKLGFKQEGILRDELFKNDSYHNLIAMSILKNEFNESDPRDNG